MKKIEVIEVRIPPRDSGFASGGGGPLIWPISFLIKLISFPIKIIFLPRDYRKRMDMERLIADRVQKGQNPDGSEYKCFPSDMSLAELIGELGYDINNCEDCNNGDKGNGCVPIGSIGKEKLNEIIARTHEIDAVNSY